MGCGSEENALSPGGDTGAAKGGQQAAGGSGSTKKSGTGGSSKNATGGKSASADGGADTGDTEVATGGTKATGKGGSSNKGDSTGGTKATAKGGSDTGASTGGTKATGRGGSGNTVAANGGTKATGSGGSGNSGMGGAATGGSKAATGGAATGGSKAATGGSKAATGGSTGNGNTTISSTCSEAQKTLNGNATGTYCGLTYEYWSDGGSGTMIMKPGGFSVNFSVPNNNFLGRMGVRPGTGNETFTYQAQYAPAGNSYLAIYGWTKNPLVEYYIVESYGSYNPSSQASKKGSATCDGGSYTLASNSRTGPSIEGNSTFQQYWAVRDSKRTSGDISIKCHFDAWKAAGMNMGSMYEVTMVVEGYHSSESADVKLSIK